MATPGKVVRDVSIALGVPEPTVTVFYRTLREAGLVSKSGRGRSATHCAPLDIGRLILSLLVTDSPARAATAVEDFGRLWCLEVHEEDGTFGPTLGELCGDKFSDGHTLEEAISSLSDGFCRTEFMEVMEKYATQDHGILGPLLPVIFIRVRESRIDATIRINNRIYTYGDQNIILIRDTKPGSEGRKSLQEEHERNSDRWFRGLRVEREVSTVELKKLGELLNTP